MYFRNLIVAVIVVAIFSSVHAAAQENKSPSRPKAPYKLLFNNDTTNITTCKSPWHERGEPFTEERLVASIDEVAGKGVDCVLLSPGMGWVPWWQSKVDPDYFEWWEKRTGLKVENDRAGYMKYVHGGGDMVQVLIDTCRKHNMAPFVSLRLNDVHLQERYKQKDFWSLVSCRLYCEHPEWHIDPEHYKRKSKGYYGKRGMDWAVPEVRAYKLKLLQELADNYDLAGLELDFLRHSQLFRDNGPSSAERIKIITAFISEVRKALNKKGGKRRWLCVRIPLRLKDHPALGLDVKKLYQAGVDMFNLSCWYDTTQNTDAAQVRKMLPNAAIYVEMTHTAGSHQYFHKRGLYGTMPNPRTSDEQFYTTARNAYARGADGMSLFNFVYYRMFRDGMVDYREPPFHVLPKLTDRTFLSKQPPYYYLAKASYENQLPKMLQKGRRKRFLMDMLPIGKNEVLRLRVHTKEEVGDRKITAMINKKQLKPILNVSAFYANPFDTMITPNEKHRRAWDLPGAVIRNGRNSIELKLESGAPLTVIWIEAGKNNIKAHGKDMP